MPPSCGGGSSWPENGHPASRKFPKTGTCFQFSANPIRRRSIQQDVRRWRGRTRARLGGAGCCVAMSNSAAHSKGAITATAAWTVAPSFNGTGRCACFSLLRRSQTSVLRLQAARPSGLHGPGTTPADPSPSYPRVPMIARHDETTRLLRNLHIKDHERRQIERQHRRVRLHGLAFITFATAVALHLPGHWSRSQQVETVRTVNRVLAVVWVRRRAPDSIGIRCRHAAIMLLHWGHARLTCRGASDFDSP